MWAERAVSDYRGQVGGNRSSREGARNKGDVGAAQRESRDPGGCRVAVSKRERRDLEE